MSPHAFSCLLPVYHRDRPEDVREALASIRSNSLQPYEIILCEDGELTPELNIEIERFQGVPLRRVRNSGVHGLHHNLNNAIPTIRTPWVARCDADDINAPDRFEKQVAYLVAQPAIDVLGCNIIEFDPSGRTSIKVMASEPQAVLRWARGRNPINHMTAFIRTAALRACGGYPDVPLKEDYALWLELLAMGRVLANLPEPLVRARMGDNFHARRGGLKNVRSEWEIMRRKFKVESIPAPVAIAYFCLRAGALVGGPTMVGAIYRMFLRRREPAHC